MCCGTRCSCLLYVIDGFIYSIIDALSLLFSMFLSFICCWWLYLLDDWCIELVILNVLVFFMLLMALFTRWLMPWTCHSRCSCLFYVLLMTLFTRWLMPRVYCSLQSLRRYSWRLAAPFCVDVTNYVCYYFVFDGEFLPVGGLMCEFPNFIKYIFQFRGRVSFFGDLSPGHSMFELV